jgi:hypothetical protein
VTRWHVWLAAVLAALTAAGCDRAPPAGGRPNPQLQVPDVPPSGGTVKKELDGPRGKAR